MREPPIDPDNDALARDCDVTVINLRRPIPPMTWCHYCGFLANTRDHIVPQSEGGCDAWWNLVPACEECNQAKSSRQTCSCLFCVRAMALWFMGHRRTGMSKGQANSLRKRRRRSEAA